MGTNGAGKSTVLDALTFALFGKPFRKINKPQLVNTTNEKDCVVEVYFSVNNVEWKIKRGIKPNIFIIEKNGVVQDQEASAVEQQKWLELNVLKMNYKSFTQIVIWAVAPLFLSCNCPLIIGEKLLRIFWILRSSPR